MNGRGNQRDLWSPEAAQVITEASLPVLALLSIVACIWAFNRLTAPLWDRLVSKP